MGNKAVDKKDFLTDLIDGILDVLEGALDPDEAEGETEGNPDEGDEEEMQTLPFDELDGGELVTETGILEAEHVVNIAYRDIDDVIRMTHDRPTHEYSVAAACLDAAAYAWPEKTELDAKLKDALWELADTARDLGLDALDDETADDDMDTDQ